MINKARGSGVDDVIRTYASYEGEQDRLNQLPFKQIAMNNQQEIIPILENIPHHHSWIFIGEIMARRIGD